VLLVMKRLNALKLHDREWSARDPAAPRWGGAWHGGSDFAYMR
jgi:hypothetical protein